MNSPCIGEASEACFNGCFTASLLGLPEIQKPAAATTTTTGEAATEHPYYGFLATTVSSLHPYTQFTNHESLPSLSESFSNFNKSYPQYSQTSLADQIRAQEYRHLGKRVCLDYIGHGLFSGSQQQIDQFAPSSSSSPAPSSPFLDIIYKSVSLKAQILSGRDECELESRIRKRIMSFMNLSEDVYSMVFTGNKSSAIKLLVDSYPFHSHRNLLTVYDHRSEAVETIFESSTKRGARVGSAQFVWPNLRIHSSKLRKMVVGNKRNKKNRGLLVFPVQSRVTGSPYSHTWISLAQENGWHVLLDASSLGAKDMETLGLSIFQPDFIICSFFKIFGENPSGFGCLFVKKSSTSVLIDSGTGIVSIVPKQDLPLAGPSSESAPDSDQASEIVEIDESTSGRPELECRGLNHADALGLVRISSRGRYLVNWLVNALISLHHPNSDSGPPLVRIYGPRVRIDRGRQWPSTYLIGKESGWIPSWCRNWLTGITYP
ncbi:Molybdenum cofactor sulfurtransferase [Bertholletia excelsa]